MLATVRELELTGAHQLDNRPSLAEVSRTFRVARRIANVGSVVLALVLVVVWPASMVAVKVMDRGQFGGWVSGVIQRVGRLVLFSLRCVGRLAVLALWV